MSVRLCLHIGWGSSISFPDFFTLCGLPHVGDSYWSNKRRYAAATHLQILKPVETGASYFFANTSGSVQYGKSPIFLVRLSL